MMYRCPECGTWWEPIWYVGDAAPLTARTCPPCARAIYDADDAQAATRQDAYEKETR